MPLILDGTKGETFPSWTTGTRPATPNAGQTGYNTTLNILETYNGTAWVSAVVNSDGQIVASAGTAALPGITTTGDTNTGTFFPAADTIGWTTGGSERARIDSSGNLLVGTTSTTYGSVGGNKLTVSSSSNGAALVYTNYAGDVGTAALVVGKYDNNNTTSQILVKFAINNAGIGQGQINGNGSGAAAFGSFSDARLKQNIVDLPSQLDNILALRPREFDYIESEGGGHQIGFIAQEIQQVYPDTVGERSDGMLTVTGWSKTEARLVKAIQELSAKLDAATARIAALEAK